MATKRTKPKLWKGIVSRVKAGSKVVEKVSGQLGRHNLPQQDIKKQVEVTEIE